MPTGARRTAAGRAVRENADAVLVTHLPNVRYLTGFTGSNGAVLVRGDGSAVLATDGRYETQARVEASDVDLRVARRLGPELVGIARSERLGRVAIERHHVTLSAHDTLIAAAGGAVEFVDAGQLVEALRIRKDDIELAALARACAVTDEVFTAVLGLLRPGIREDEVSWAMTEQMRARGAEPGFESIVAFGPNSAIPHHRPTDRALARGDLVKMDFGARVDGYHADMTRTIVVGRPAAWQRDLHALVLEVQEAGRAAAVPGAIPVQLDAEVRSRIEAAGQSFPHGLGHGVGLEIHESPFVVPESTADRLEDGVPVTIEPGVYLPGRGGVRIEDTVVVRAGGAESLTGSRRDLIEI